MRLDNNLNLHVKSAAPFFALERDGRKPNTLRVVDEQEFDMCTKAQKIAVHGSGVHQGEWFKRTITGMFDVTGALAVEIPHGLHLVLIQWTTATSTSDGDTTSGAETPSSAPCRTNPTSEAVEAAFEELCRAAEHDDERDAIVTLRAALTAAEEGRRKAEDAVDDYCGDYCEGRPADEQRAKCASCPLYGIAARDAVEEGR